MNAEEANKCNYTWRVISELKNVGMSCLQLFPALKRKLGGHRFKKEIDMKTVFTRWHVA